MNIRTKDLYSTVKDAIVFSAELEIMLSEIGQPRTHDFCAESRKAKDREIKRGMLSGSGEGQGG